MKKNNNALTKLPATLQTSNAFVDIGAIRDGQLATIDEYVEMWGMVDQLSDGLYWARGEMANQVFTKYNENGFEDFAKKINLSPSTLNEYRRAVRAYPTEEERTRDLSFSHFIRASYADNYNKGDGEFGTEERYQWLDKAEDKGWSAQRLSFEIAKAKALTDGSREEDLYLEYMNKFENTFKGWDLDLIKPDKVEGMISKLRDMIMKLEAYRKGIIDGETSS